MGSRVTSLTAVAVIGWLVLPPSDNSPKLAVRKNVTYSWVTGHWGQCYSLERCGNGEKERHVSCFDSDGLRALEPNCDINKKPSSVTSCFRVCEEHRNYLWWKVEDWGPCLLPHDENSDICRETGIATRNVTCIYHPAHGIKEVVEDSACSHFDSKPEDVMLCSRDCPQDCVVTEFEPWTNCNRCEAVNRTKSRKVVVAPNDSGKTCPPLSEMAPCSNVAACLQHRDQENRYILKLGRWSECRSSELPLSDVNYVHRPLVGQRFRNVTCLTEQGNIVNLSNCWKQYVHKEFETAQSCIVPVNCTVSPWSEWSIQDQGCITSEGRVMSEARMRYRWLLRLPEGEGLPCPPFVDRRVISNNLPVCDKYKWVTTEWSECIVVHQGKMFRPHCGGGVQLRNVTCLKAAGNMPVSTKFCKEAKPVTIQRCHIMCPQDCVVSEWSQWSPCLPQNKTNFLEVHGEGYKIRRRTILVEPSFDGKECPTLEDADPCDKSQIVMWEYGAWSLCEAHDSQGGCGKGIKMRPRKCVKVDGSPAVEALCTLYQELEDSVPCYISCPEDCVLSEWSEWSHCSVSCTNNHAGGIQIRNRTILSPAGPDGKQCPSKLYEDDICNPDSCSGYKWKALPWNECHITRNASCGKGVQNRTVYCTSYHNEDVFVSSRRCKGTQKPIPQRNCSVPCPVDCIVTEFSEWSACPEDCNAEENQFRQRYILQSAKHGGIPCPEPLIEERPCWKNNILCVKKPPSQIIYRWNVGTWSICIIPPSLHCGQGYQVRTVACIREDGRDVEPEMCINRDALINDQVPVRARKCYVSCEIQCTLSEWSEWSLCDNICISKMNRTRTLIKDKHQTANCKDHYKLVEEQQCPPPMDLSSMGSHWQECIVDENATDVVVNGNSVIGKCGTGRKYRQADGFDMKNCHQTGLQDDLCVIECPRDCKLDSWSSWTVENNTCGNVYRFRGRKVVLSANKFGRPCPQIHNGIELQTEVHEKPCNLYSWNNGNWKECKTERMCGSGKQEREIKCIKNHDRERHIEVSDKYCKTDKPLSARVCYKPCPKDCVVSEWSEWSECDKCSSSFHYRKRKRVVLRQKAVGGKLCPSLVESEACILGNNCFYYEWKIGNWSSCILPQGAFCGEGIQRRATWCICSTGQYADASYCINSNQPISEQTEKACYVDCPIDCEVSQWTRWDTKECEQCGPKKKMIRSRHVIQPPSERGQPCLHPLIQHKPCPFNPCYHWRTVNWSKCNLQGATCGYGTRNRTVHCIREDGVMVSNRYCFLVNWTNTLTQKVDLNWLSRGYDKQESEECHVPCPRDCQMSDWTEWSHCHRDCSLAEVVGYQARSRIIQLFSTNGREHCPEKFWESRPCWSGPCLTFSWQIKGGRLKCVRSDGLIVDGGCRRLARPCNPPCRGEGIRCNASLGICQCVDVAAFTSGFSRCQIMHSNSSATEEVVLKYYPDDTENSFWMYAMISIGSGFVVFVVTTLYLMCHSSVRQRLVNISRQANVRRRTNEEKSND